MAKASRSRKSSMLQIPDLSDVEEGGGSFHIPEGEYRMKCESVELTQSKSSDNEMFKWVFVGLEGKAKNKKFFLNTVLTDNALWKLKETVRAMQIDIPEGAFEVDPDDCVDVEVIGHVVDRDYEGKTISNLDKIESTEGAEDDDEDGDDTSTKRGKPAGRNGKAAIGKSKKKWPADDIADMNAEEMEDVVEKSGIDLDLGKFSTQRRKANALIAALEAEKLIS